ncbi:MAG: DJ-1/PfpI family protein, partial [Anaerolineales bacterium]
MKHYHVSILIAPGFDERLVVSCLSQMREAGVEVSLVGLMPGLIKSYRGLKVHSDISIDQLPQVTNPQLILVPGGHQCTSVLMADPRAYRLVETTLAKDGFVAVAPDAQSVLTSIGFPLRPADARLLKQEHLD